MNWFLRLMRNAIKKFIRAKIYEADGEDHEKKAHDALDRLGGN